MRIAVSLLTLLTITVSGCSLGLGYLFMSTEFPHPEVLRNQWPMVEYRPAQSSAPLVKLVRIRPPGWVSLGSISRVAIGAVVVSEDWAFYQHKGYDPNQIREAVKESIEEGSLGRGASTITQQVVRNVFLTKEKKLWRKVKELYLAVRLEESVRKSRILEVYFNIAEWGPGIYGIGRASRYYFNKTPAELTAKEGAFLAMLLPSPIRYGVSFRSKKLTDYAQETVESILRKMTQAHYLTEEERDREMALPLPFETPIIENISRNPPVEEPVPN
jgi:monofunctional biosynthetic peptidoglycan transglycosylase